MKTKSLFAGLLSLTLIIGMVGYVMAAPDGPQRLRGLDGRTFAVEVTNLTTGESPFNNCYTFNADGSWDDPEFLPGFPVPGVWEQYSTGAKTTYTAAAIFPLDEFVGIRLIQDGTVTPAGGRGVLQLDAFNVVDVVLLGSPDNDLQDLQTILGLDLIVTLAELTSVGEQDNGCGS